MVDAVHWLLGDVYNPILAAAGSHREAMRGVMGLNLVALNAEYVPATSQNQVEKQDRSKVNATMPKQDRNNDQHMFKLFASRLARRRENHHKPLAHTEVRTGRGAAPVTPPTRSPSARDHIPHAVGCGPGKSHIRPRGSTKQRNVVVGSGEGSGGGSGAFAQTCATLKAPTRSPEFVQRARDLVPRRSLVRPRAVVLYRGGHRRDHLHRLAQVVPCALSLQHLLEDLASECGATVSPPRLDMALTMLRNNQHRLTGRTLLIDSRATSQTSCNPLTYSTVSPSPLECASEVLSTV